MGIFTDDYKWDTPEYRRQQRIRIAKGIIQILDLDKKYEKQLIDLMRDIPLDHLGRKFRGMKQKFVEDWQKRARLSQIEGPLPHGRMAARDIALERVRKGEMTIRDFLERHYDYDFEDRPGRIIEMKSFGELSTLHKHSHAVIRPRDDRTVGQPPSSVGTPSGWGATVFRRLAVWWREHGIRISFNRQEATDGTGKGRRPTRRLNPVLPVKDTSEMRQR